MARSTVPVRRSAAACCSSPRAPTSAAAFPATSCWRSPWTVVDPIGRLFEGSRRMVTLSAPSSNGSRPAELPSRWSFRCSFSMHTARSSNCLDARARMGASAGLLRRAVATSRARHGKRGRRQLLFQVFPVAIEAAGVPRGGWATAYRAIERSDDSCRRRRARTRCRSGDAFSSSRYPSWARITTSSRNCSVRLDRRAGGAIIACRRPNI